MLSGPEILRALASELPPTRKPPWLTALRMVMEPVTSATPVPTCCSTPRPTPPVRLPVLVPRMKLLGRVTPPAMSTRVPLPEATVTSPAPKAPALLARTL